MAVLLATPVAPLDQLASLAVERDGFSAFTIIPDRPRSEVFQYEIESGDTIFEIAERFGLKPETIAWSNDRSIIGGLRPGRRINILPIDGAYITVVSTETIASIASRFHVDPYIIIDSEYNPDLFGASPDTELPSGTRVVVPGGEAEEITWIVPVERVGADASGAGGRISFNVGDPGSCGLVDNPGGGGGWIKPLSSYQWVRGFTSFHTGVDLSAAVGTPVMAANGGTVIFAGWSSWGYGYSVVLAHGPFTTLYGHMSAISARCGSYVNAGQVIGAVGSTGDSSGPHLHFEIRYNDIPTDPTGTMAF
jgi:murein DD-endopeptidase MepM/ murein hydrolase activator NlpD